MSQSTMRGMRLGANSLESEVNVRFEARTKQAYECALGHRSELNFAADAEVPETWECKVCSKEAVLLIDGVKVDPTLHEEKIPRSHWQMLLERRTIDELQVLLDEQLANLQARRAAAKATNHI
ncbi:MAG: hypothetical protein RL454_855 [Actinomycetota bacterium]